MKSINGNQESKHGFAIIVMIGLAAMVLLLGASLLTFVQIESGAMAYDQRLRTARANARLALNMALGDLQKVGGQDSLSTAQSRFYGAANDEQYWTGVYDFNSTSTSWLATRPMSGSFTAIPDTRDATWLKIVGSGTAGSAVDSSGAPVTTDIDAANFVYVPLEDVKAGPVRGSSSLDPALGQYAYWVGDQGVKASFGFWDETGGVGYGNYSGIYDNELIPQILGQTIRITNFNPNDTTTNNPVLLGNSLSDLQYRSSSIPNGLTENDIKDGFHDLTLMTRGVLEDRNVGGGLKSDASSVKGFLDTRKSTSKELERYHNIDVLENQGILDRSSGNVAYNMTISKEIDLGTGDLALIPNISPVITGFNIVFDPSIDDLGKFSITYSGYVELWNPYTNPLLVQDLYLRIDNLPELKLLDVSGGAPVELKSTLLSTELNVESNQSAFSLPKDSLWLNGTDYENIKGGRIISFSGNKVMKKSGGYVAEFTQLLIPNLDGPAKGSSGEDRELVLSGDSVSPTVKLLNATGEILFESSPNLSFSGFSIDLVSASGVSGAAKFGYTWDLSDPSLWLARKDPRIYSEANSLLVVDNSNPNALDNTGFSEPGSQNYFVYHVDSSGSLGDEALNLANEMPLFELPFQEQLSLLNFRHASLDTPTPPIGEPNSNFNQFLDEYFLSSLPIVKTDPASAASVLWKRGDQLANTKIEIIEDITNTTAEAGDAASKMLLKGAFNINSLSAKAWASLLKSIRKEDFSPSVQLSITAGSTSAFYVRYPQTAIGQFVADNKAHASHAKAYREGVRFIDSAKIDTLAQHIVNAISLRTVPFRTIEEFLNSGIVNAALQSANVNGTAYTVEEPAYLTQTDILAAIAPYLTVRSDTFLIRAYGNALNPNDPNDIWAEAYCEAIVQRFPEKHPTETDSDPMSATSGGFGRQFKIIAFRWMLPEEI
ncbi:hypothetical protein MLD52_01900 [Puniceicoccaceae bacterium K14]|nr:hypothetical protein [Puniceicoccaceae bacterium K14]